MNGSLFSRLAVAFLLVVVVSTAALGLLLSQLLERHVFDDRAQTLGQYGEEVAGLVSGLIQREVGLAEVMAQIRLVSAVTGAQVWIVDRRGFVIEETRLRAGPMRVQGPELQRVLTGQRVVAVGEFAEFDIPVLTVAVPVLSGEQTIGAVLLHSPVGGIRQAVSALLRLVWVSGAVGIGLAMALAYVLSRRIVGPLRTMAMMSEQLSAGDFSLRVPESAGGEIGMLAHSFNDMAMRLDLLERTRREFIATISHELKSPLTSIRGFVQAIIDGTIDLSQRERYLALAFQEIERLKRLIDELLLLASLEAGNPDLEFARVDLAELVGDVSELQSPAAHAAGVRVVAGGTGRPVVSGDGDRLKQVLLNLVDNAIRFSPSGGEVSVRWSVADSWAVVRVSDQGPGIPPEELPRVWDRFYKADHARTRSGAGSGLGLSIARSLVRAHGGDVTVNSERGKGSTFTLRLPLDHVGLEG